MAFEIIVKAQDTVNSDPVKDRKGCGKKGDIAGFKMLPHSGWGNKEGLPRFVVVRCNDNVSEAQLKNYRRPWLRTVGYEVVTQDAFAWSIRVYGENVSVSGENILTREQIENYLNQYGGFVTSASTNEVIFTLPKTTDIEQFKKNVTEKIIDVYKKRRFYFDPDDVDTAIAAGGFIELTKTQLLNKIKDKLDS